jgi:hypothetical protein
MGYTSAFESEPNRPATQKMRPADPVQLKAAWEIAFDSLFVVQRIVVDSGLLPHEMSQRRLASRLTATQYELHHEANFKSMFACQFGFTRMRVKVGRIAAIDQQP